MKNRFFLIVLCLGVLSLTGAACGRSSIPPKADSKPSAKSGADGGTETIEPEAVETADDSSPDGTESSDVVMGPAGNNPQAPEPEEEPDVVSGETVTETPAENSTEDEESEAPSTGPTYGDGGGGIPYNPSVNIAPEVGAGILLGRLSERTPGAVNVFFRNDKGHLCRVMGPPELVWGGGNRAQTACFDAYTIDRPPQVVFDPNRRKIYAFAVDVTGDLGQAHGFRFYVCEADSIQCTASTHLLWESRFHFYPALAFVKGATPAQDRILGFSHAGEGGPLAYFSVNPESLHHGWGWVGSKLIPGASVTACGEQVSMDRSPVAFFSKDAGGEALHVMARTGDADLLHLKMSSRHLAAFQRGEAGLKFSCRKISETYEGRDGLGNMGTRRRVFSLSPNAVWRGGDAIDVFGGVKSNDFSATSGRLWPIDGDGVNQPSWIEDLTSPSPWGPSMTLSLQLAPEERLTLVTESAVPESSVHLFANVSQYRPAPGTESEVTVHGVVGAAGVTKTMEILPFRFGGQTAAVTDDKGNLHLFGASYEAGSNGHFRLMHAARPANGGFPWVNFRIAAGQSIQKGGRGAGESGVTAVWVPGKNLFLSLMQQGE